MSNLIPKYDKAIPTTSCWGKLKSNNTNDIVNDTTIVAQRTLAFNYFPNVWLHCYTGLGSVPAGNGQDPVPYPTYPSYGANVYYDYLTNPKYTFTNSYTCPVKVRLFIGVGYSLRSDVGGGVTNPIIPGKKYLIAGNLNTTSTVSSSGLISSSGFITGRNFTWDFENPAIPAFVSNNAQIGMTFDFSQNTEYEFVLSPGGTLEFPIRYFFNAFYEDGQYPLGQQRTIRCFTRIDETVIKY